jgi:hypothetical protein
MRRLSVTVALGFIAAQSLLAFGKEPNSNKPAGKKPYAAAAHHQIYVIECRLVTNTDDGDERETSTPTISVPEGRTANIRSLTQTPFVTSVKVDAAQKEPRIVVLNEGYSVELSVHDCEGLVSIDATVNSSKIVDVKKKHGHQAFRHETRTVRVSECVALGEVLTIDVGGPDENHTAEFVVSRPDTRELGLIDAVEQRALSKALQSGVGGDGVRLEERNLGEPDRPATKAPKTASRPNNAGYDEAK